MDGAVTQGNIFTLTMANHLMLGETLVQVFVLSGVISHDLRFFVDVLLENRNDGLRVHSVNHHAPGLTGFSVYKRQDLALVRISLPYFFPRFIPKESLIRFYRTTVCAKRSEVTSSHSFPNPMPKEPRALNSYSQHSMKLIAAYALLRRSD